MKRTNFKNNGFTLVEVLVVIAIISILTTILLPNFSTARLKSNDANRKSRMKQIQSALETYKADQAGKKYPISSGKVINDTGNVLSGLTPGYLPVFPYDPADPRNVFYYNSDGSTYTLCAHLEYSADPELNNNNAGNNYCNALGGGNECGGKCNYGVINP